MAKQNIEVRALAGWDEMAHLDALQREIWPEMPECVIPAPLLASLAINGGAVLGAWDGARLVGGAVALLGAASLDEDRPAMANLKLASERVMVLPEYRNQGIGYHLKLAEYQFATRRGIRLMTWMYDPLAGPYAHLSVRKLGAVVSGFLPAFHTSSGGPLATNPDRFHVEWWLAGGRAVERLKKRARAPLTLDHYLGAGTRILNPATLDGQALPVPSDDFIQPQSALSLIEIPDRLDEIQRKDRGLLEAWQAHTRAIFGSVLSQGFVLTDFLRESYEGRPRNFYVCSHEAMLRQFDRNFNQN
jgi:predicted GNAT superfamily acetyltransferase